MIDLTEESHPETAARGSKFPCPICRKLFYESDIETHVNQCLKHQSGDQASKAQCSSCGKEFESSLLSIHEEQCEGRGSSEEDERRRLVGAELARARSQAQKTSTLDDLQSPPPSSPSSESEAVGKVSSYEYHQ